MLGVVITHGIGEQSIGFADDFITDVNHHLGDTRHDIQWAPFYWADLIPQDEDESRYWYPRLRDFFDNAALDLMGYAIPENYDRIHERLGGIRANLRKRGCDRLAMIGHSLGTIVLANHIHDNLLPVDLLITFGSPLRQYLIRRGSPPAISPTVWKNYYHPTDIVAKPINGIHESYRVADIPIWTNPLNLLQLLPITHTTYWSSQRFIRKIADSLKEVI